MQRRRLPGTDLELSVLGLGCWTLGGPWWGPDIDDARAQRTVHAALDAGLNWLDTAPLYGNGRADRIVAQALAGRPEVVVATKVGVRTDGEHAESDLSAAHIVADCEASLRRLGRDRIDLLQVHWPCERGTPLEESLSALASLQERGLVRHIGLCNYDAPTLARARQLLPLASLQTPYSLLRREAEAALLPECATLRGDPPEPLGVIAYEVLCRGLLTGRYRRPPDFPDSDQRSWDPRFRGPRFAHARALLDDLQQVADKVGAPLPALSLGWALQQPGITLALAGARSPEQIQQSAQVGPLLGRPKLWSVVARIAALHGGS